MGNAYFYRLGHSSLARTLTLLASKAHGAGWSVGMCFSQESTMGAMDDALWGETDFLPHASVEESADPEAEPILLATEFLARDCIISVGGFALSAAQVKDAKRVCIVFDGDDPQALDIARGQFKQLKDDGVELQFWSEASGNWALDASANAPKENA